MATTVPAPGTGVPEPVHHRKNIELLNQDQLAWLRAGITATLPIADERGYQFFAGIHGLPLPAYCVHHQAEPLFLPWHRAYLYFFELAIQDQVPEARLPWWDWTSPASQATGIPEAYAVEQADGEPNPLHSAPIEPPGREADWPERTWRNAGRPNTSPLPNAQMVAEILALDDFLDFSNQLENFHDAVHVWVGGTMADIAFAAYDPLFWAHHCMVDRIWRLWQLRHPSGGPPAHLLNQALPPFAITVAETLDVTALGYEYAAATTHVIEEARQ